MVVVYPCFTTEYALGRVRKCQSVSILATALGGGGGGSFAFLGWAFGLSKKSSCILGDGVVAGLAKNPEATGFAEQTLHEALDVICASQWPTRVYVV